MPSEWKCFVNKKKNQSHLPKSHLQLQNWRSTDLHKLIISQQTLLITSQQQRISVLNKIWGKLKAYESSTNALIPFLWKICLIKKKIRHSDPSDWHKMLKNIFYTYFKIIKRSLKKAACHKQEKTICYPFNLDNFKCDKSNWCLSELDSEKSPCNHQRHLTVIIVCSMFWHYQWIIRFCSL